MEGSVHCVASGLVSPLGQIGKYLYHPRYYDFVFRSRCACVCVFSILSQKRFNLRSYVMEMYRDFSDVLRFNHFRMFLTAVSILLSVYLQIRTDEDSRNRVRDIHDTYVRKLPITVTALSKEWVCGRSLAGIMGSNPAEGMNVCVVCVCVVR